MNHLIFLHHGAVAAATSRYALNALSVEYLSAPLGIDVAAPRFGWALVSLDRTLARNHTISKFHVQVSRNQAFTQPVDWDAEPSSQPVVYSGKPLLSDTLYHFRVAATLNDNSTTSYAISSFHTGLFFRSDWAASQWIGSPQVAPDPP